MGNMSVRVLNNLCTVGDMMRLFKRTELTIRLWCKYRNMPVVQIPGDSRPAIRFDIEEVTQWAEENGMRMEGMIENGD
jgi:hypothetical protein